MEQQESDQNPAENTEPPANPEPDEQAVEQGQEQLDKVSGN
jgi:hypothetical protein